MSAIKRTAPTPEPELAANGTSPKRVKQTTLETIHLQPQLLVQRLTKDASLPSRGSEAAAGYDLYASEAVTLAADSRKLVSTGISVAIPPGCYGRVAPRSGIAVKHGIDVGAGVVDSDYRGEVKVLLFNLSKQDFKISKGDRIAQMVLERISTPEVLEVESLSETTRGEGGFGSTGGFTTPGTDGTTVVQNGETEGSTADGVTTNGTA